MERREFAKLGILAAIATVAGIQIVHEEEVFTISNRPHPDAVFTEESLRRALDELESREYYYRMKQFHFAYRYSLRYSDWKGLIGNV